LRERKREVGIANCLKNCGTVSSQVFSPMKLQKRSESMAKRRRNKSQELRNAMAAMSQDELAASGVVDQLAKEFQVSPSLVYATRRGIKERQDSQSLKKETRARTPQMPDGENPLDGLLNSETANDLGTIAGGIGLVRARRALALADGLAKILGAVPE
jgi:transposase-like protein